MLGNASGAQHQVVCVVRPRTADDVSGPPLVDLDAPAVVEQRGDVGRADVVGRVEAVGRVAYGRMTVIPVGRAWSSSTRAAGASANPISRPTNAAGRTTPDRTRSSKAG